MATKDITDKQVVEAYLKGREGDARIAWPYQILQQETGECEKVCYCAMERADRREFIDYGVSLRSGWVTEKGMELLK